MPPQAKPMPSSPDPTPAAPARRRARVLFNLAMVAVTVAFAYLAFANIDLEAAWRALRTSNYWWLAPTLIAFALGNLARALRWRSLFAPGRRPDLAATLNAMLIGYLYNNLLPARAGEAARVLVLAQRSTSPPVEIAGTVVLERLYDVVALLLIFFIAEPWLPHVGWFAAAAIAAGVLALAIAALVTVLAVYGERPVRLLLRPLGRFSVFSEQRQERIASELAHGLSGLRDRRVALEALAWTTAAWLLSMWCAYLLTLAFHLHLPFAASVLVMVAIGLGMIVPSPPAAVGVFEGATVIALHAYRLTLSTSLPYAIVLHLVNLVFFLPVGAVLLHHNARHPHPARLE